jgi:hypothetical protein
MARLPIPGSDDGTWGDILNDFLSAQHNADGTHSLSLDNLTDVNTAGAVSGQVLKFNGTAWVAGTDVSGGAGDPAVGGDLTGTASNAQIAAGAIVNADVSATAAIAQSKIANLTSDLASKEATVPSGTTTQYYRGDKSWQALDKTAVGLANVDNTADLNKPISTATQTALDAKADETVTVTGSTSLTGGGDLTANRTLSLVGDAATPGNSRYYGTDGTGTKGFHTLPVQDPTLGGDLTGTASNAQIAAGAIVDADISATAAIAQSKVSNLTTDLSNKLNKKNDTVTLTDSTNDKFLRVDINNDASPSGGWPDRLAFYYAGVRTGYHNEYGELRARPAKNNTVALRAMYFGSGSANIFEVAPSASGTEYFAVSSTTANLTVPLTSTTTITATNLLYTTDKGAANGVAQLDGSGKIVPGQLATANITKLVPYSYTGTLAVTVGTFRLYNDMGATWTISGVRASVGTAPAGASVIVDVNKNGTTIFTTQANRPTIAAGANTSGNVTNMNVTTVAAGEYLTIDIDQIGSTTAGADLTVQIQVV